MENKWTKILAFGLIAGLLQILFLNNINLLGLINPKVFPIFFLLYPKNTKPIYLMLLGFFFGLIIDSFSMTDGVVTASSVFICFVKSYIFNLMYTKRDEDEDELNMDIQGVNFILRYLFISLFIFHLVYFFVELGEVSNIFYIAWKSALSAAMALFLYGLFTLMFSTTKLKKYR